MLTRATQGATPRMGLARGLWAGIFQNMWSRMWLVYNHALSQRICCCDERGLLESKQSLKLAHMTPSLVRQIVFFFQPCICWPVLSRATAFHKFQVCAWGRWLKCRHGHKSRPSSFQLLHSRLWNTGTDITQIHVTEQSSTGGKSVCYTCFLLPSLKAAMQGNAKTADIFLWIMKG